MLEGVMNSAQSLTLRPGTEADTSIIFGLIQDLAAYEKLKHEVVCDEAMLKKALFAPSAHTHVVLAEVDNVVAGFALYFYNFSTFLGRSGIYLEDLFVKPEFRGQGIGGRLLTHLAQIAVEQQCGRLEWSVLNWNKPSIDFYEHLGAKPVDGWTVYRLTGDALTKLGTSS